MGWHKSVICWLSITSTAWNACGHKFFSVCLCSVRSGPSLSVTGSAQFCNFVVLPFKRLASNRFGYIEAHVFTLQLHCGTACHYQAVIIIRNKVTGIADEELALFDAIITRLDFAYSDKRPIHVIKQELATLRQNGAPLLKYYDEVGKKLTPRDLPSACPSALTLGMRTKGWIMSLRVLGREQSRTPQPPAPRWHRSTMMERATRTPPHFLGVNPCYPSSDEE